jgi:hypothetical protein
MSPSCCITSRVWSAAPDADAAAGDDGVGLARGALQRGGQRGGVVAHEAEVDHLAAQPGEQAEHGVAVAVVHRAFARRIAQAQDLVAGREERHAQPPQRAHAGQAQARDHAERGGRQALAAAQGRLALHEVFAGEAAVVAAAQHGAPESARGRPRPGRTPAGSRCRARRASRRRS